MSLRALARRLARRWPPTLTSEGSPSRQHADGAEDDGASGPQVQARFGGTWWIRPRHRLPDADVDAAVRGINIGRFFNAGQACLAAKRVYVFDEIYDEFLEGLTKRVSRYELGDGMEKAEKPKIRMGPSTPPGTVTCWQISSRTRWTGARRSPSGVMGTTAKATSSSRP